MALIKLNHALVRKLMEKSLIRPIELARMMRISRQQVHYLMYRGGVKHARDLAEIFDVKRSDLLVKSDGKKRQ